MTAGRPPTGGVARRRRGPPAASILYFETFGLKQNRGFQSLADPIARAPKSGEPAMRRHLPSFEGPGCA